MFRQTVDKHNSATQGHSSKDLGAQERNGGKPKILHNLEVCSIVARHKTSGLYSVISYNLKFVTIFERVYLYTIGTRTK